MPRRKRRPKPSEIRPGDELVANLRKKLPKKGGSHSGSSSPWGVPATPRLLEEDDWSPPVVAPSPRVYQVPLSQSPPRPRPGVSQPVPQQLDFFDKQAPPGPRALGVPRLEDAQRVVATPPNIPQVLLPEGTPKPPAEETPAVNDAPICPLLGSKCLHEWCEWWDGINSCQLVNLSVTQSHVAGRLQALQDWLTYRLGDHP